MTNNQIIREENIKIAETIAGYNDTWASPNYEEGETLDTPAFIRAFNQTIPF